VAEVAAATAGCEASQEAGPHAQLGLPNPPSTHTNETKTTSKVPLIKDVYSTAL